MPKLALKNFFLLIMSLLFYGYGEPQFVFVMLLSIFINWSLGLAVDRFRSRSLARIFVVCMVVYNIGIFFVYKYLNFAIANVDRFFGTEWQQTGISLPIGISFFTFQAMSYVIDVYRGTARVQKNPFNTALYICLFPQLIAGPIVRYGSIADQLTNRKFAFDDFSYGIRRFIIGLSKKLIFANMVAVVADQAFESQAGNLTVLLAWLGVICYSLQIYFDFSGYSDMAIGLGRMFGFRFDENFNYPYIAKTVTEFWRRWHISLSSWFRDYVYFPLGGSRVNSRARLVLNLFVVWMLTGVWHGAGWTYIFWGFFYFVLLTFEKLFDIPRRVSGNRLVALFYRLFTILCFMVGWVIFRANGLKAALSYILVMFGFSGSRTALVDERALFFLQDNWLLLLAAIIACCPVLRFVSIRVTGEKSKTAIEIVRNILLIVLFVVCVSYTVNSSYNPFIYFNF